MEDTIKRLKNGETDQVEVIIGLYQQRIYSFILKMTGNHEDALDLTQEVFITVYQKIHLYRYDDSFMAWIYKIARNHVLKHLKMEKVKRLLAMQVDRYEEPYFETLDCFDPIIEMSLQCLTIDEKTLLLLRSVEDLSYKELSLIYKLSESSIRKRYERVRKKFSECYSNKSEEANDVRRTNQTVL